MGRRAFSFVGLNGLQGYLLVVTCWLLVVGCWLLVVGCWLLVVGCWLLVAAGFLRGLAGWLCGSWLVVGQGFIGLLARGRLWGKIGAFAMALAGLCRGFKRGGL